MLYITKNNKNKTKFIFQRIVEKIDFNEITSMKGFVLFYK